MKTARKYEKSSVSMLNHIERRNYCWHGCNEALCTCIEKNKRIQETRKRLIEKRITRLKSLPRN